MMLKELKEKQNHLPLHCFCKEEKCVIKNSKTFVLFLGGRGSIIRGSLFLFLAEVLGT
jgi:hypothetical protein